MRALRNTVLGMVSGIALAASASGAFAATIVKVDLWDKGAGTAMATNLAYATAGMDMSMATMGVNATPATAAAGIVSFEVTNGSKDTVHEMIVMYLADPAQALPYIVGDSKVDEDKAGDKGEVSELDPGKSGTLTVALKPGKYILICNVAGHFMAGMWTPFEVTK